MHEFIGTSPLSFMGGVNSNSNSNSNSNNSNIKLQHQQLTNRSRRKPMLNVITETLLISVK
jgi:hypothetical protein